MKIVRIVKMLISSLILYGTISYAGDEKRRLLPRIATLRIAAAEKDEISYPVFSSRLASWRDIKDTSGKEEALKKMYADRQPGSVSLSEKQVDSQIKTSLPELVGRVNRDGACRPACCSPVIPFPVRGNFTVIDATKDEQKNDSDDDSVQTVDGKPSSSGAINILYLEDIESDSK